MTGVVRQVSRGREGYFGRVTKVAETSGTFTPASKNLLQFPNAVVLIAVGSRNAQMSAKKRKHHRVLQRGAPEGATILLHFAKSSRPFIQSVKAPFLTLRVATPFGGTPSSTA